MISVEEAFGFMKKYSLDLGTEEVAVEECPGRILQEPVHADRDFPPFDRVTKDGIAVQFQAVEKGRREFQIQEIQAAGEEQKSLRNAEDCMEVMTGAILPKGTDTVIPYEEVEIREGVASLKGEKVRPYHNIHGVAEDAKQGDVILNSPVKLSARHINTLATVGKERVKVARLPKVALISTGDELVGINEKPQPHQIRQSNTYAIQGLLREDGIQGDQYHLKDDQKTIKAKLEELLEMYDVLMISGGVSKGKFDYVPECLKELGVEKAFHGLRQRPGKPFWFGIKDDKRVFALPGNPLSTFVCYLLYFRRWLGYSTGMPLPEILLNSAPPNSSETFWHHRQVVAKWNGEKQQFDMEELNISGSGDLVSMNKANGLLSVPPAGSASKIFFTPFSSVFFDFA